ncbi:MULTISPECIES: 8-amino-7-oxononanoate synthase [Dietzia]|uniref:8-amino-7-oxononanoate synthase n=1 Tax=Dietzia cinnamea TaxID=321318 RepID=A0A4R3ZQP4_9ACTN|nr:MULTISPECIES: 8-amino-7-oxononanoate synthase [Dietzia]KZO58962.1 8-amino-7-oxononanoate synthase [Dietzia maris]MBS7546807.1 8-amino-7-oxononanoate synthase [Dietzia massiliensis]MCT2097108.1 8-amino-7-oxononanoate synthase [Dietzia cinnamea]MCT2119846.1 8-amino-7-oxononanoate synthase [Dietzia cinnamea]MCT2145259.1 8-amino-7-oxononanoate synthase [Dietzia cinnamea]
MIGPSSPVGPAPDRSPALDWLDDAAADRAARHVRRVLAPRAADDGVIDLASNDYLGLGRHPEVVDAAVAATRRWGAGATGSRLVTGTTEEHLALEDELAEFTGKPAALVFSSGYTANLGAVVALSGRGSLIVSDGGSHASLVDACRLARARVVVVDRGDVAAAARALAERTEERALVVTDSVYSADGELAPLLALHGASRAHGAVLLVDEAHGLGVRGDRGRGLVDELGLSRHEDVVVTATLSKALGSQGGVVLASERVREHLISSARTFIFDTGLAPAAVGAARAALGVLRRDPSLASRVVEVAEHLAAVTGAEQPRSAVVSVILGDPARAVSAAGRCLELGVRVGCFRPPSVPEGTARLRLTARADLSDADLARASDVLAQVLAEHGHPVGAAARLEGARA